MLTGLLPGATKPVRALAHPSSPDIWRDGSLVRAGHAGSPPAILPSPQTPRITTRAAQQISFATHKQRSLATAQRSQQRGAKQDGHHNSKTGNGSGKIHSGRASLRCSTVRNKTGTAAMTPSAARSVAQLAAGMPPDWPAAAEELSQSELAARTPDNCRSRVTKWARKGWLQLSCLAWLARIRDHQRFSPPQSLPAFHKMSCEVGDPWFVKGALR